MKLKIGAWDKIDGYTTLDIDPMSNPDIIADARNMSMVENNSIDEIFCEHVLEHIPDTIKVMSEFYRVLKPNGKLIIIVPHGKHHDFWGTPDHVKPFIELTFKQFRNYNHYPFNFIPIKIKTIWEYDRYFPFRHRRDIYAKLEKQW